VGLSLPKKKEVIVYTSLTKQQKAYYEGAARTLMVCNVLTCVDRMLVGLLDEGHARARTFRPARICLTNTGPSAALLFGISADRPVRTARAGRRGWGMSVGPLCNLARRLTCLAHAGWWCS
jgi:hypothetical protein